MAFYRALGRNRKADGTYLPETAQRFAWARRLRGSKLERRSPAQGQPRVHLPLDLGPIGRRERPHHYLAPAKPSRGRCLRAGRRHPAIPNRTLIHSLSAKPSCSTEFGHWVAVLMHFRRQRDAWLTLLERKARITPDGWLASKRAEPTTDQIGAKLASA